MYVLFLDNPLSLFQCQKTGIILGGSGNSKREIRGPRNFRRHGDISSRRMAEEVLQRYDSTRLQQEDTYRLQHAIRSTHSRRIQADEESRFQVHTLRIGIGKSENA